MKVRRMGANGHVNMVQREMTVLMLLGLFYLVFTHGIKDRPAQVIRCALYEREREDGQVELIGMEDKPAHKHSVKVVKNAAGDVFDCVEISKQPAFNHPLLKNHTIQMRPSSLPEDTTSELTSKSMISEIGLLNEACPMGTIPIMRTRKLDVAPANPIPNFEIKNGSMVNPLNSTIDGVHYFAQVRMLRGKYYGSIADLNVYRVSSVSVNQHSSTAIWVVNDNDGLGPLEIIVVGWIVHPQLYGDTRTRFFTYWDADGSQNRGCFDLLCSGFIQVSSTIPLGAILSPLSDYDGHQYVIRILVFKDPLSENWWLLMGKDVVPVGYWPKSLFTSLSGYTSKIYWGGEVFTPKNEKSPPMGDGCYIEYGPTCYVARLKLVGEKHRYRDISVNERHYYQNKHECYDVGYFRKRKDGQFFTFGGPGGC